MQTDGPALVPMDDANLPAGGPAEFRYPRVAAYPAPILGRKSQREEPSDERSVDKPSNFSELSESEHHIWC